MLDQIRAQQTQAETALGQAQADVHLAEAQYAQAVANAKGAEAQAVNAAQDLKRYQTLQASTPQAVAQGQIDQAVAAARSAAAQRDAAQQQAKSATAQIASATAAVAGAQARIDTARAQVKQSQLNLEYTRVVAPVDGHVTRRTVAVGTYVAPGQQMLAIVPLQVWITANFKETQLAHMQVGQEVTVEVDSCPDVELRAHVDSLQRGAGQAFALLPPENATGQLHQGRAARAGENRVGRLSAQLPVGPRNVGRAKVRCVEMAERGQQSGGATQGWTPEERSAAGDRSPWLIAGIISISAFMEVLDTAIANVSPAPIANVSLRHIAGATSSSYDESTWVLTSYLIANAIVIPLSSWLSDVIGRKRYYMISVGIFTVASLCCGLARACRY